MHNAAVHIQLEAAPGLRQGLLHLVTPPGGHEGCRVEHLCHHVGVGVRFLSPASTQSDCRSASLPWHACSWREVMRPQTALDVSQGSKVWLRMTYGPWRIFSAGRAPRGRCIRRIQTARPSRLEGLRGYIKESIALHHRPYESIQNLLPWRSGWNKYRT